MLEANKRLLPLNEKKISNKLSKRRSSMKEDDVLIAKQEMI
jgi:hypothetical protein